MSRVREIQVTFDCEDPRRVGLFWCEVLGYVMPPPPPGFETWDDFTASISPEAVNSRFAIVDPEGIRPRLFFQRVPERKQVKNRVHLDVRPALGLSGDERLAALEGEAARLVELGATRIRREPGQFGGTPFVVMQDVEGNEFCLD